MIATLWKAREYGQGVDWVRQNSGNEGGLWVSRVFYDFGAVARGLTGAWSWSVGGDGRCPAGQERSTAAEAREDADRFALDSLAWKLQFEVELIYFKASGKYYSEGKYVTFESILHVADEVERMRYEEGKRPGLVDSRLKEFYVLVRVPGHPHDVPHLLPLGVDR